MSVLTLMRDFVATLYNMNHNTYQYGILDLIKETESNERMTMYNMKM